MEDQNKKEQLITIKDRKELSISGTRKILSLKTDLIQLLTVYGNLSISGNNLELLDLDNSSSVAKISGNIDCLKFLETKQKENLFKKIFK